MQVDLENIKDWSAYKRQKRREASERMEVIVITVAAAFVFCVVLASFWMRARRDEAENADLVEMFEGGAR